MKIFCVGRNYVAHVKELGNEIPDEPIIFMKPKSALLQAHTPFYYPEFTNELHHECELVLRISKNGKYIQERFASKYYDAVTAGIDFTARDIQNELKEKGLPWEKAKAWDNSAVIGKWILFQNIKNKKDINLYNAVIVVGVRNKYDGVYSLKGYSLRAGDATLTGNFTGASRGLVTTGPNSVIWDDLAVWGDGVSGIGIGEPEFAINPTTNKVIITSPGGGKNNPPYDSRYDPVTRTFYVQFTWGAGPAARLSTDTLTYTGPRP